MEPGISPAPIRQMLLKVHSRCNLACNHCYVYEHVDQSWRRRPYVMSPATIEQAAARIAEHAGKHDLPFVIVILHGGEPLLAGVETLENVLSAVRLAVGRRTRIAFGVQTNGLLLDETFLELFSRYQVRVGVSLDGPPAANDRHRVTRTGKGSHALVARALNQLMSQRFRHLYGGILCTVDLKNDPLEVYEHLLSFGPPEIDFLLPHGNWDRPPAHREPASLATPYADWLRAIFDRWYHAPKQETRTRLFDSLISLLLGGPGGSEMFGLNRVDMVTVETDGTIEMDDVLKTAAQGAAETGLHVEWDSFDDFLHLPDVVRRQTGLAGLSDTCRGCSLVTVCGGGHYAHRFREASGYANPSVYCADLAAFIRHVASTLAADLSHIKVHSDDQV